MKRLQTLCGNNLCLTLNMIFCECQFNQNCSLTVDADINSRDYSGKKPRQVAKDGLTIEAQGKTITNRKCGLTLSPLYEFYSYKLKKQISSFFNGRHFFFYLQLCWSIFVHIQVNISKIGVVF